MSSARDVVVVGGGIIGAAVAERLAREGLRVTLVERGEIGGEASYAAAGLLTPVHPWNYPDAMLALDDESLGLWPDLAERLRTDVGVDLELRRTGLLSLLLTDEDEEEADRRVAWKRARGERAERLDAAAALESEPLLDPELRGVLLFPDLAQVRNHRVAPGLARAAAARGAEIRDDTAVLGFLQDGAGRVTGVRTSAGEIAAGVVVVAAGAWSGELLAGGLTRAMGGPRPRTIPARGQMLVLRGRPGGLRHMILAHGQYLVPRADGRVLAGSTVEYSGFDSSVTAAGLRTIADAVVRLAPGLASAPVETSWAGLRPDTPDHLPLIGEIAPGLVAATGHFRSGIMLAPVTARIVLEIIRGECTRDLAPFDPLRPHASRSDSF